MYDTNSDVARPYASFRVLVVEDDLELRQRTVQALRDEGLQCDAASDGLEAIRMADWCRYDLVITDLGLPRVHGQTLVVDLLRRDDPPRVVVLTGNLDPKMARRLLARGVDGIAFKPMNLASFAARVKRILTVQEPVCP